MKHKKKILIIFALLLMVLIFFIISSQNKSDNKVCFVGSCIDVELATTPEERTIGLMNRKEEILSPILKELVDLDD
jgi:hypothetical protein